MISEVILLFDKEVVISSAECKVVSDIFGEIEFLMEYENIGLYAHFALQGVQECSIPCFRKISKNIKSTMSLTMIVVIEFLICDLPTVKISFTYLYPLR